MHAWTESRSVVAESSWKTMLPLSRHASDGRTIGRMLYHLPSFWPALFRCALVFSVLPCNFLPVCLRKAGTSAVFAASGCGGSLCRACCVHVRALGSVPSTVDSHLQSGSWAPCTIMKVPSCCAGGLGQGCHACVPLGSARPVRSSAM